MEQTKKINKTKIVSLLLIATIVSSIVAVYAHQQLTQTSLNEAISQAIDRDIRSIKVGYKIELQDGETGEVKDTRECMDDLPTENLAQLIKGIMLTNFESGTSIYQYFRNDVNTVLQTYFFRDTGGGDPWNTGGTQDYMGGWIYVGNGTDSPSYTDYNMATYVTKNYASSSTYSYPNVTVSGTVQIPYDQGVGISEAGLAIKYVYASSGYTCLYFRDTFTPIAANQYDNLVVTYYFQLGDTSFTDNFGKILAECFLPVRYGVTYGFSLTDVAGSASTFNLWDNSVTVFHMMDSDTGSNENVGVRVGTGTAAENHTDYTLDNDVTGSLQGFDFAPALDVSGNNWNITSTVSFQLASSYSITEACVNAKYMSNSGAIKEIMLWRNVFSAYSYTAYDWINVGMRFMY